MDNNKSNNAGKILCVLQFTNEPKKIQYVKGTIFDDCFYLEWKDYDGLFIAGATSDFNLFAANLINDFIEHGFCNVIDGDWNYIYNIMKNKKKDDFLF